VGSAAADLTYVDDVTETLAPLLRRPSLVVGKSTVPVGTAARTAERLAQLAPAGAGITLAWNPEFLREGHAVADTTRPDRIVVGVTSPADEATLREVYAPMLAAGVPFLVTDLATAELVKVSANAFLATKISFINAMSEVCEAAGADVTDLAAAIGYDDRIGPKFLQAGLGFGGGCLPKDIRAFMARAGELGVDQALTFLREVDEINQRRRARAVDDARVLVGGSFAGRVVAVLGAAFKPNSDDVRDSPALYVAAAIATEGGQVRVHDPEALANAAKIFPTLTYVDDVMSAVAGADVVLHLTEWSEYRDLDPEAVGSAVRHRALLDGRNALDADRWRAAGWTVHAMGRPSPAPAVRGES
jgi:UDPglucose 6-dehydrogenase